MDQAGRNARASVSVGARLRFGSARACESARMAAVLEAAAKAAAVRPDDAVHANPLNADSEHRANSTGNGRRASSSERPSIASASTAVAASPGLMAPLRAATQAGRRPSAAAHREASQTQQLDLALLSFGSPRAASPGHESSAGRADAAAKLRRRSSLGTPP